jgi:hypothetical protein
LTLGSSLEPTNSFAELFVFIEMNSKGSSKVVQFSLVLFSYFRKRDHCSVLLMHKLAQSSLSLDKTVGNL